MFQAGFSKLFGVFFSTAFVILALHVSPAQALPLYQLHDVGPWESGVIFEPGHEAVLITDNGTIVYSSMVPMINSIGGQTRGYFTLDKEGITRTLNGFSSGTLIIKVGISEEILVVQDYVGFRNHLMRNGVTTYLPTPGGMQYCGVKSVSPDLTSVGSCKVISSGQVQTVIWYPNGIYELLPTTAEVKNFSGFGFTPQGRIFGTGRLNDGLLGPLEFGMNSTPQYLVPQLKFDARVEHANSHGDIAGAVRNAKSGTTGQEDGFILIRSASVKKPFRSYRKTTFLAINDNAVLLAETQSKKRRQYLLDGKTGKKRSLPRAAGKLKLLFAGAINSHGEVAAACNLNGVMRVCKLAPKKPRT